MNIIDFLLCIGIGYALAIFSPALKDYATYIRLRVKDKIKKHRANNG